MKNIFISYRREDAADVTGRINDRLRSHFGEKAIFTDVDGIPLGLDFRAHLDKEVGQCEILLAVIGRNWLIVKNNKEQPRLFDPTDFVRIEIESALQRGIPVIPLLVQGIEIPAGDDLPESLRELSFRNAIPIRPDPDFHKDMDRLIMGLDEHLQREPPDPLPPSPTSRKAMALYVGFAGAIFTAVSVQVLAEVFGARMLKSGFIFLATGLIGGLAWAVAGAISGSKVFPLVTAICTSLFALVGSMAIIGTRGDAIGAAVAYFASLGAIAGAMAGRVILKILGRS